jgi:hypothetical protein
MGRKAPSPGLSETDQLALSQFFAGHLTAGQLSERLQRGEQHAQPSSERPPGRHRSVLPAALGGVVAAIAATAVALAISARPHVAAPHSANTGRSQASHTQSSARVVSTHKTTSSLAQAPSMSSGERLSVAAPATPAARQPKSPKQTGHRLSKPRHLRAPAGTVPTTSSTGGNAPTATTPTATTPAGATPTGTAPPPPGSPTPPGATTTGGG